MLNKWTMSDAHKIQKNINVKTSDETKRKWLNIVYKVFIVGVSET